jgi:putative ABC transport system substrate-binding protein
VEDRIRRRDLPFLAGAAFASLQSAARVQQPRRVGFLRLAPPDATQFADFRAGLEETGYAEGRNLVIEYRYADGNNARLPELAVDLVGQNVEVIVTSGGTDAVRAAMRATTAIPIVGTSVDPGKNRVPLVKHFNRPEGNVTGVSIVTGELTPKRLQILAELVPGAAIGVLMNPTLTMHKPNREEIEEVGRVLRVKLVIATVSTDADLDTAFASLADRHVGAILPEADPFLGNSWRRLVVLADRHKIPMMQEWREAVAAGGLMSYAPSFRWVMRQVGRYTGQVLKGAKPADLPVVAPTKIELAINLKTAKALGLTVPQSLFARADEVIE